MICTVFLHFLLLVGPIIIIIIIIIIFSQDSVNECRGYVLLALGDGMLMGCSFFGLGHPVSSDFYAAHVFTFGLHDPQLACSLPRHPLGRSASSNRGFTGIPFLSAPGGARSPEEPHCIYIFSPFHCVL